MLSQLRGKALYRVIKTIASLSFCMYGYDAGVLGGLLLHPPFQEAMGNPTGSWIYPMIVSSYALAAFFGSIGIATFTMKIGRRGTIIMGNIASIVASLIQATSYGVPQMIVGRVLNGFAIGAISSAVPAYLNECASGVEDRGPANALSAMFVIGGVPIAYWIDYGFVHWFHQASWRIPIMLQVVFAIPAVFALWFLPDTPRWYYARGRHEEGDATLARVYDADLNSDIVQETKRQIIAAIDIELEATESIHWYQFLTSGIRDHTRIRVIRRLSMAFWIPMLGEWMGISLLGYFAPVILKGIGINEGLIGVLSGVLATCSFLGTIPVYWTIEIFGRRNVMLSSAIASTILYCVFIAMVSRDGETESWVAIALLFIINPIQTHGWQAAKFLYSSEIAPLEYRHIGGAFFAAGEWLMVFITVFACPIGLEEHGWPFWFFILAGNVLAIAFVVLLCPETQGKTLEQIDFLFIDSGFAGLRPNRVPGPQQDTEKMDVHTIEKKVSE